MKGYCVDVCWFSLQKKEMVVNAIRILTGCGADFSVWDSQKIIGNISGNGEVIGWLAWGVGRPSEKQIPHLISFNDLMSEAGLNYAEDGVEGFKEKSLLEAERELAKTDSLIESLGVESDIISDLQSDIEGLQQQLRMKSQDIGSLRANLREAEKELSKSRISGAACLVCLAVVAVSNLFFGG